MINKFSTISTKDFTPISHKEQYLYNKYNYIQSFLDNQFNRQYSNLLSFPLLKDEQVDWYTNYEGDFKRISDFPEEDKNEILKRYWEILNNIKKLTNSFDKSGKEDKRNWSLLLDDIFNSNNNIIFSNGSDIVILWGWKFNTSNENFLKEDVNLPDLEAPVSNPITFEEDPINNREDSTPWYQKLWHGIISFFSKFWWMLLLIALIVLLSFFLKDINCNNKVNKAKNTDFKDVNNPVYEINEWNIDDNNTGLDPNEFNQIVNNNNSKIIYENLLIDDNGNKRNLPKEYNVPIPISNKKEDFLINDNITIVPDRINVVLKEYIIDDSDLEDKENVIKDFSNDFYSIFPKSKYQIIYVDLQTMRMQIRTPIKKREEIKSRLKKEMRNYDLLIWDEQVFFTQRFNDPGLKNSNINWYLENINAPRGWEITDGDSNIIIAIVDDGFDLNHKELNNNIVSPWNVVDKNNKVYASSSLTHGSHVAGIAIAKNNNKFGISGIAPNCSFMPIQICTDENPYMSSSSIIDGILYAINNDADVINLSIQTLFPPSVRDLNTNEQTNLSKNTYIDAEEFWNQLFQIAKVKNTTIVFCAGNLNMLIGVDPMLRDENIIIVSAVDQKNQKADFSNFGRKSTISAPGVDIYSCAPGNKFIEESGTSMAAPIITGTVALMKSLDPDLTTKEIITILKQTSKDINGNIGELVQIDKALLRCGGNFKKENESINCKEIIEEINDLKEEIKELEKLCGN